MKCCPKKGCFFYFLTVFANIALIVFAIMIYSQTYGREAGLVLLLLIPPVLSLLSLRKGGDKEERTLKKRIRKANLRKELDELKKFDKTDEA